LSVKITSLPGGAEANSEAFVRYVADTYYDDFRGYRIDILKMEDEPWQQRVGEDLQNYRRVSVGSGHGIGKTGFAGSAIHWFLGTRPNPAIVATANTEQQLTGKLWRELAKRNNEALNKDWFTWSATKFAIKGSQTAFASAIPWSENNAEAFAGTHEKHVLGVFDESSGIPPIIWTTWSGAMSTEGARWLSLGNPTRNEGTFYEAVYGKLKWRQPGDELQGKWKAHQIPSYESSFVDKGWVEEQKAILGVDSDDYRVRVLGLPPRQSADQFLNASNVYEAAAREPVIEEGHPLILGVDVARQGQDRSVILPRVGYSVPDEMRRFQGLTLKHLAHAVALEVQWWREEHGREARAIFIEGGGSIGWGVIEELWELGYSQTFDVNPGSRSMEPDRFVNMRNQMWGHMKDWFDEERCSIPNNEELLNDLLAPRTKPDSAMRLKLETKDEMRRRGVKSPDFGDALALTFAAPVNREKNTVKDRDFWAEDGTMPNTDELGWMSS
jgi:hypothetical protein